MVVYKCIAPVVESVDDTYSLRQTRDNGSENDSGLDRGGRQTTRPSDIKQVFVQESTVAIVDYLVAVHSDHDLKVVNIYYNIA